MPAGPRPVLAPHTADRFVILAFAGRRCGVEYTIFGPAYGSFHDYTVFGRAFEVLIVLAGAVALLALVGSGYVLGASLFIGVGWLAILNHLQVRAGEDRADADRTTLWSVGVAVLVAPIEALMSFSSMEAHCTGNGGFRTGHLAMDGCDRAGGGPCHGSRRSRGTSPSMSERRVAASRIAFALGEFRGLGYRGVTDFVAGFR